MPQDKVVKYTLVALLVIFSLIYAFSDGDDVELFGIPLSQNVMSYVVALQSSEYSQFALDSFVLHSYDAELYGRGVKVRLFFDSSFHVKRARYFKDMSHNAFRNMLLLHRDGANGLGDCDEHAVGALGEQYIWKRADGRISFMYLPQYERVWFEYEIF